MEVVSLLVALAMLMALFFVLAFWWASKNGQWDDLETPAFRMLLDDNPKQVKTKGEKNE